MLDIESWIHIQFGSNQWIQGITYVCTERIFACPQFVYIKIFLKKLSYKLVIYIFTLLLTIFASKSAKYKRRSESLNIRKNPEIGDISNILEKLLHSEYVERSKSSSYDAFGTPLWIIYCLWKQQILSARARSIASSYCTRALSKIGLSTTLVLLARALYARAFESVRAIELLGCFGGCGVLWGRQKVVVGGLHHIIPVWSVLLFIQNFRDARQDFCHYLMIFFGTFNKELNSFLDNRPETL